MPPKKDTKLKHVRDLNNEDCPSYANMTEIKKTLDLDEEDKAGINNLITKWLEENKPPTLNLRSETEKKRFKPLVTIIDTEYKTLFEDYDPEFIKVTIMALIQRYLYNQRRKPQLTPADELVNDRLPASSPQPKPSPSTPVARQSTASATPQPRQTVADIGEVEDYGIRGCIVTNSDHNVTFSGRRVSPCSVGDILRQPTITARSLFQQLSFDIWLGILTTDLNYTPAYKITYDFEDGRCAITNDRTLKAAVIDSRYRGHLRASFDITPPGMSRHLIDARQS